MQVATGRSGKADPAEGNGQPARPEANQRSDEQFDDWRGSGKFEWLRDWFAPRPAKPGEEDMPRDRAAIDEGLPRRMSDELAKIVLDEARPMRTATSD